MADDARTDRITEAVNADTAGLDRLSALEAARLMNAEDRKVVEGLYEGTGAPLAKPGRLSWLEREIHDFMGYLDRGLSA